jgi:hypothetical protein
LGRWRVGLGFGFRLERHFAAAGPLTDFDPERIFDYRGLQARL